MLNIKNDHREKKQEVTNIPTQSNLKLEGGLQSVKSKVGDILKVLWPSQNVWTLRNLKFKTMMIEVNYYVLWKEREKKVPSLKC